MGRVLGGGEEMLESGWLHNSDYKLLNCTVHEAHVIWYVNDISVNTHTPHRCVDKHVQREGSKSPLEGVDWENDMT